MAVAQPNVRSRRRRRWIAVAAVVAILATGAAGYLFFRNRLNPQEQAVAGPETVTVAPRSYRIAVAGPGTLQPARSFEVSAEVGGRIVGLVEVGDRIDEGAALASIEPTAFERALTIDPDHSDARANLVAMTPTPAT